MSDNSLDILGCGDVLPVLTKKVPVTAAMYCAQQQTLSINRLIRQIESARQTLQGSKSRLSMNQHRRHDIDDQVKGWFASKDARNQAYLACAGIAFVAFLVGTLVG